MSDSQDFPNLVCFRYAHMNGETRETFNLYFSTLKNDRERYLKKGFIFLGPIPQDRLMYEAAITMKALSDE